MRTRFSPPLPCEIVVRFTQIARMTQGWKERIQPHDYGAPEGTHAVKRMREQRSEGVPRYERIRASDVTEMTLEQYETAFAFQEKIYQAHGFDTTDQLQKDFDPSSPLCYVPKDLKPIEYAKLHEELDRLVIGQLIPSYMRSQFAIAINDLKYRHTWVYAVLNEASRSGADDGALTLQRAYELVSGETDTNPNLISLIATPASIHFVCGDLETADRIATSYRRTKRNADGSASVLPYTARATAYAGMAIQKVHRQGAENVVSVGVSDREKIQRKDPAALADAFQTFRHEFDHQLFALRKPMHAEQDAHELLKYERKIANLHQKIPALDGASRDEALRELQSAAVMRYYYDQVNFTGENTKFNAAVRAANEFMSQYLDKGASNAHATVLSEYYLKEHFPTDIEEECSAYVRKWVRHLDVARGSNVADLLSASHLSYRQRVLEIRTNQMNNAFVACFQLEMQGFSRHEVADMLRLVPFNRWRAFARRYGHRLMQNRNERKEAAWRDWFASATLDQFTPLLQSEQPLGKLLLQIKRDMDERLGYRDTFVYYTGGMVGNILKHYSAIFQLDPKRGAENQRYADALLFAHARVALERFASESPEDALRHITAGFEGRNYMRDERNSVTERAATILAYAIKQEFPSVHAPVTQIVERMFANIRK